MYLENRKEFIFIGCLSTYLEDFIWQENNRLFIKHTFKGHYKECFQLVLSKYLTEMELRYNMLRLSAKPVV